MPEIYYTKCYLGHNHDWNVGATSNVRKTSFNQYECSAKMTYHKGLNKTRTRIIFVLRQIFNEILRQMLGTNDSYNIFCIDSPRLISQRKPVRWTYHRNNHMESETGNWQEYNGVHQLNLIKIYTKSRHNHNTQY